MPRRPRPPPKPKYPLPPEARVQAVHQSSPGTDLYTFPLTVRADEPIHELAKWFEPEAEFYGYVAQVTMYGMPPIGECTAACGAGQPHLYAGMAYHAAAAERAAAELLAAEGGEKGKKRRRVRTKNKRKSGDGGGGEGGDGGDGGRTSPTILDSDHAAALDARPANHSNNNGNANTDAEDDTAVAVTSKTTPPTAPLLRTCFCATCLNPPTRLARLDDTDQEDN